MKVAFTILAEGMIECVRLRSTRRLALLSGLLLVALFGVLAEDAFLHTDDGCAVERHCLACRTLVSPPSLVAASVLGSPALTSIATVPQPAQLARDALIASDGPSRAPPLS